MRCATSLLPVRMLLGDLPIPIFTSLALPCLDLPQPHHSLTPLSTPPPTKRIKSKFRPSTHPNASLSYPSNHTQSPYRYKTHNAPAPFHIPTAPPLHRLRQATLPSLTEEFRRATRRPKSICKRKDPHVLFRFLEGLCVCPFLFQIPHIRLLDFFIIWSFRRLL